jgi:hypothetical protein
MQANIMIALLVIMFIGHVIITYKKLIRQHDILDNVYKHIEVKKKLSENTDTLRREHNAIVRAYNHNLDSFIGKRLAQKLKYEKKEVIEKI